jgi:hypothetical protein
MEEVPIVHSGNVGEARTVSLFADCAGSVTAAKKLAKAVGKSSVTLRKSSKECSPGAIANTN